MDIKILRIIGLLVVIGLVAIGLNFMPDKQADVKIKKQNIDKRAANLEAFGRLYGYIRYFHPSDESASLDWTRFGVYGAEKVKDAANERELKAALNELFLPIAPTLSLYIEGEKPSKQAKIKPTSDIVAWQHYGPPGNAAPIFRSNRTKAKLADGRRLLDKEMLFSNFPKTGEKFEGQLGKSLRVSVPLTLYIENGKTLGTTKKSWEDFEELKKELLNPDRNLTTANEDYRYAGIISSWNMLAHFHPAFTNMPYEEVNGQLGISLKNAANNKTREDYIETLSSLMLTTNDGLATFSFPDQVNVYRRLPFVADLVDGQIVITVAPQYGEFKTGDIIETINGEDSKSYIESLAKTLPGSPQFKLWSAIDSVLGNMETKIVYSHDGHKREVSFTERDLHYIDEFNRTGNYGVLGNGIYYINSAMNAIPVLDSNREELIHAKGIIIDLRTSGLDDFSYAKIKDLITNKPAKSPAERVMRVIYPYRKDVTSEEMPSPDSTLADETFKGKVVFLSYGGTIGRAEHFLTYVKENQLGTIVGQPTAGASGTYQSFPITLNLHGIMTGAEPFSREGYSTYAVGVEPDIPVVRTMEGVRNGVDEYIEKALEMIRDN
ncbi:S41 family peptidase [Bacillus sp. B-jedd]|uniref:S41 family peptidase n=1 Tax=Bacillus sp. B-jedd TaxID=1476857 RepID=UPI0005157104|nr:S41 family peptidase [Bacillus sp. B-jedd]CEG26186.1 Peptidase family S41 [Bacillus sp. B-jedd]